MGRWLFVALVLLALGVIAWASDRIGYQGERTIYTVQCRDGAWSGVRCTGTLAAGERYRFLASRSRQEVLFWIVGSAAPSGKYAQCTVADRGNWNCRIVPGEASTIIHAMADGKPVPSDATGKPTFHAVRKWQWWLLNLGVNVVNEADYY